MLPKMPYNFAKSEIETFSFLGINHTENNREGEMSNSRGITLDSYPSIKTRKPRERVEEYKAPTDVFEFDSHVAVVDSGILYYDGVEKANVGAERKQWATVNRQIIIYPDKIWIDADSGEWGRLNASVTSKGGLSFNGTSVSAELDPIYKSNLETETFSSVYKSTGEPVRTGKGFYAWSGDDVREKIEKAFNSEDSSWDLSGIDGSFKTPENRALIGDVFIPSYINRTFSVVSADTEDTIDTQKYNSQGFYAVITNVEATMQKIGSVILYDVKYYYDVYLAGRGSLLFSSVFETGQTVDVKISDVMISEKSKILSFADNTNTVELDKITLIPKGCVITGESALSPGTYRVSFASVKYYFTTDISIPAKTQLLICDCDGVISAHVFVKGVEHVFPCQTEEISGFISLDSFVKVNSADLTIELQRSVPDLDYICSRENRLWGVSNKDRTVYASSLGDAGEFWTFDGVSTDSYAVAIGSEGDFTGICSYNSAVVIFKEKKIYKILGSYPAEFYTLDYQVSGLQKGCERSIAVINEILFYKGLDGVYKMTSGVPQLISYNLGTMLSTSAVAAADARKYIISFMLDDDVGATYSYDLLHGLWVKTDDAYFTALCSVDNTLWFLTNGEIYKECSEEQDVEWMCEFVPTCEKTNLDKIYTKLFLCAEISGTLNVEISIDGAPYINAYKAEFDTCSKITVPLRLPRCHRMQIRLSGKGQILIRQMTRELHAGGGK